MSALKTAILSRLRQPSTYAGVAAIVAGLGISHATEISQTVIAVGAAVAGLLAIWLPEGK